jgi:Rrf2 family protein
MINSRFAVAVHLLTLLSMGEQRFSGEPLTSETAAGSVNTNPVVIRRILGSLRKAGMVRSQPGPNGGWFLARKPSEITLRDVYLAVEDDELFSMHHSPPSQKCPVGANIQTALNGYFREAEAAMERKLGEQTIEDVIGKVRSVAQHAGSVA